ncbi:hypothetical protein SLI_7285 [Streptomyces lividans 1326]|uniref:Uncharacterized protein n=1 Tax=Streptomyces lividans 1326 TaxID=1200984 RepID=A0A7U9DXK3_STRLI|nr:hypothetical protein SLI_7285 [Streptomyces lividans 1326]
MVVAISRTSGYIIMTTGSPATDTAPGALLCVARGSHLDSVIGGRRRRRRSVLARRRLAAARDPHDVLGGTSSATRLGTPGRLAANQVWHHLSV